MKGEQIPLSENFTWVQRSLHHLMFKADFISDLGLFSGKMGIVLFFAHLHKLSLNSLYEDIADELMAQLLKQIHKGLPIGLASGYCGIGWGIEYLIQNNFMEGCGAEMCEELDQKIMEKDIRRLNDLSLDTGLEGILHYVLIHLKGAEKSCHVLPFDQLFLEDLFQVVCTLQRVEKVELRNLIKQYKDFYQNIGCIDYQPDLSFCLSRGETAEREIIDLPLGLKGGIAGMLLDSILNDKKSYEEFLYLG